MATPAKGFKRLTEEQVNAIRRAQGAFVQEKTDMAKIIDDALDVAISELPTNIPQANVDGLVAALAGKMATAAFTDAAVTGKLLTGFVSGAGTVLATDTILAAFNKVVGNIAAKLTASPAASQAAIGTLADVTKTDGVGVVAALADDVDDRVATLQVKIDAIISALKTAGIMTT